MTQKSYTQLTYEQRCQIEGYLKSKISPSAMAGLLGVHRSTIYREITRNQGLRGYRHRQAERLTKARKASPANKLTGGVLRIVQSKLAEQWSPMQISGWMKQN